MSEQIQKVGFGYTDDNSSDLQSKSGGKFGLNQGYLTKFEYNPNAGADGAAGNAIDVTIQVGEREFRSRFFEITKVFNKDNQEIEDVNSTEYIQKYNENITQLKACIVHIVKAYRTDEEVKTALATPPSSFADWAKIMCSLVPETIKTTPIDLFLEYQWNIKDGQDITYLQLPQNMKGGRWISRLTEGEWNEDRAEGKLVYRNATGESHLFERSANYMESNKANQQKLGETGSDMGAGTPTPGGDPKSATW